MEKEYIVVVTSSYVVDAKNEKQARKIVEKAEETHDYSRVTINDQEWDIWEKN
jgi:hypothetical protein